MKFYRCNTCHNVILKAVNGGPIPACCGEEMEELTPNSDESGATEKHIPMVEYLEDGRIRISIGEKPHPSSEEHHISFLYLEMDECSQIIWLEPTKSPRIILKPAGHLRAVYCYCNIHGLWVKRLRACCP